MKKLILITLILLLHSFPSFGDPKGKGLICGYSDTELVKMDRNKKRVRGYYFDDKNSVQNLIFVEDNENLSISTSMSSFQPSVDYFIWLEENFIPNPFEIDNRNKVVVTQNVLERKTLKLFKIFNYDTANPKKISLYCKIVDGFDSYSKFIKYFENEIKPKYDIELKKLLQKNKI